MKFSGEAPAKINRELRVGAFRSDGYHEIRSRVVAIDLADVIEVETGDGDLALSCEGLPVPSDESNLVLRAARALANHLGRPADAAIRLEKKIPVGAGLGGGSSDAARALALLARLWDARLTDEDLRVVAASLGSDVPFFLVGGEAEVTGRGEHVTPLPDSEPTDLLVLVPPFPLSTGEVYATIGRARDESGDEYLARFRTLPRLRIRHHGLGFRNRSVRRGGGRRRASRRAASGRSSLSLSDPDPRRVPAPNRIFGRFPMEITQVKVFPVEEERLKAYVSIVLDDCFLVSDLKVIQGPNGVFVSMPSKRKKNGEFKDIAHPLNRETRERMEGRILSEYEKVRAEAPAHRPTEEVAEEEPAAREVAQ